MDNLLFYKNKNDTKNRLDGHKNTVLRFLFVKAALLFHCHKLKLLNSHSILFLFEYFKIPVYYWI